jgi:neutral amino acid transport system ATP-binding protein
LSERDAILQVRGISKAFGGIRAVRSATFNVERGSISSLIGPNGAGKTTAFNLITGFYRADEGEVLLDGSPISALPSHEIARVGMTRTFQTPRIIRRLSVLENMMLAAPQHPGDNPLRSLFTPRHVRKVDAVARERAEELLDFIALRRLQDTYAGQLSGGQRKLLEFGRALMARPQIVLLDEPMAGVNRTLGNELMAHIRTLRETQGVTFLIIEHDMDMVMRISDEIIVLNHGEVLEVGSVDQIRRSRAVIDAYLGGDPTAIPPSEVHE